MKRQRSRKSQKENQYLSRIILYCFESEDFTLCVLEKNLPTTRRINSVRGAPPSVGSSSGSPGLTSGTSWASCLFIDLSWGGNCWPGVP